MKWLDVHYAERNRKFLRMELMVSQQMSLCNKLLGRSISRDELPNQLPDHVFTLHLDKLQDLNLSSKEVLFAGETAKDGQFLGHLETVGSQETLSDALERMAEELHDSYS
ncbi:hypothetical protein DAPPUDRAFT_322662 [Daphnia pulex]|uniref:Uncharacterized protein n=1 Tax=Daphnia pulex TaxID=6669 RepID=E9GWN3_DAPPU|nr:hypothetical protein DAPPUDRAFT_322662 [Daphnia pulex]|eukprot:EFX76149.1 hypothetical protein DAPPUDRAFT_322662 [Daphnia pulex]